MSINEATWRETYTHPGGISTCMSLQWLLNGCPKCGCTEWGVTNDAWAYCDECGMGIPTDCAYTNQPLEHWGKDGFTCFMCHGTGKMKNGEPCDECEEGR